MDNKKDQWLLVYMDRQGESKSEWLNDKASVESQVKYLVKEGITNSSVIRIFPPNTNLTSTEFLLYQEG
ncbi:hypothetical protein SP15_196 [Bacillus phage SP-15]|uniref:Uncharacterized protein n=1 Tax=Bacillus phage SP-15 TaxID=1792032 RepID=A0A127AWB8_9CAUD|nr:hypothetical protein SP15_196 [Bacillus phage SP-15]AMM44996.1 hypothetical protein SP15_196 [Bacillus phage SP-15]